MSGGSWDYLYNKDARDLVEDSHLQELVVQMAERLEQIGGRRARNMTRSIAHKLQKVEELLMEIDDDLRLVSPVWKSVEWADSCDTSHESARRDVLAFDEQA